MIAHLRGRSDALVRSGWTRREAEWLALVCLHSGVFLRSQYLAFIGRTNPALANRFVRRCRKHAVEQPWNGSRLRICRIAARRIYRLIGAEHVRHRRPAAPDVVLRRLLSLDYVLEHPHAAWLPTEDEKVKALTAAGIAKELLPLRLYQGAVGAQQRYFPHKLPVALDGVRSTFLFVQTEDQTASEVRTWGSQHAALWAELLAAGRAVEVVVVGRDPVRLDAAGRVLDKVGGDASRVRDHGPPGGGGRVGRDPQGDGDERLGRARGVGRHQRRVAALVRSRRRLHPKRPIEGGDHERADVALEAGAGIQPCRPRCDPLCVNRSHLGGHGRLPHTPDARSAPACSDRRRI